MKNTEVWGPAPTRDGAADLVAALSPPRRRVFDALDDEPQTVAEISRGLGVHVNTAREHLDALVSSGLALRSRLAPKGRGRPGWGYTMRPGAASLAIGEYAALARVLADHVSAQGGDVEGDMRRLGRGWGIALVEGAATTGQRETGAEADVRASAEREVTALLGHLGFDPEQTSSHVRLRQCPMLAVARERPDVVCSVHQGMIEGAMEASGTSGEGVRLDAFSEIGACRLTFR